MRRRATFVVLMLSAVLAGSQSPAAVPEVPADPLTGGLPTIGSTDPANPSSSTAASEELVGLFAIRRGECAGAGVTTGSYFRMYDPGGGLVTNGSSPCGDKTFTPLRPGTDGGLATSRYQPHPAQPFDGNGNGLNDKITQPEAFYGTRFSTATNSKDPQTDRAVGAPSIGHDGGKLSGDLRAFAAGWQAQHFNQGSPKPDGTRPGQTSGPSGTYNPSGRAYVLDWKSLIVGGPFNNFTGTWHLEGTFTPSTSGGSGSTEETQPQGGGSTAQVKRGSLASTGPPVPPALAIVVFGLGVTGLWVDALLGRRRTSNRKDR